MQSVCLVFCDCGFHSVCPLMEKNKRLIEASWIEKLTKGQFTEELYKRTTQKRFHDPDIHDGVIIHLEPNILKCEVKWALGSITTNKVSGGDGIPVELFQILKDDAVKMLHSTC